MKKHISIEDLAKDPSEGFLKVRLFVYLNSFHKLSERNLDEITEKTCKVFGSDVSAYVTEWINSLNSRVQ